MKILLSKVFIIGIIFFNNLGLNAQGGPYFFERNSNIDVIQNGNTLSDPWAGAWNNPQFSEIDVDLDGKDDLYVFDRSSEKSLLFLWVDSLTNYRYAPQYDSIFPRIMNFGLMYDYDLDGDPDLFSHVPGGIKLHKNLAVEQGETSFVLENSKIMYDAGSMLVNIYVSSVDLPALKDVDGDGDMDILTFDILGGFLDYYENTSIDNNGNAQNLEFIKSSDCWGKFVEPGLNNTLVLAWGGCKGSLNLNVDDKTAMRHAGSSILAFDPDDDNDIDLLLGDVSFNNLVYAENSPNANNIDSIINQDTLFPSYSTPAQISVFPAAFEIDVDKDGLKDLIAAPNVNNAMQSWSSTHWYKNNGVSSNNQYTRLDTAFLQKDMIDIGERSIPVFVDYNKDGLIDLLISNYGKFENNDYKSFFHMYENTGSALTPEWTLVNDDWLAVKSMDLTNAVPTFGDLNGDQNEDMIVGDANGKLHYFEYIPSGGSGSWILMTPNYMGIDVGQFAAPVLYDFNHDGLNDIIVGKENGLLSYFQNTGTATTPSFVKLTDSLGQVDVKKPAYNSGYSYPHFANLDSSGNAKLLVAGQSGLIQVFEIDTLNITSSFSVLDTLMIYDGTYASLTTANIDNDGRLDLMTGNQRGGLGLYASTDSMPYIVDLIEPYKSPIHIKLYPNPSSNRIEISSSLPIESISMFDLLGNRLMKKDIHGEHINMLSVKNLENGVYFIQIVCNGHLYTKRIVKQ